MKISYFNCDEKTFLDPIKGRPFSNNIDRIEITDNHEESDYIFGYLDYLQANGNYEHISKSEIYQKYKSKFVFYSMHDSPSFAYKDKEPIKILCQPTDKNIEDNNIIVCPLQMRHFEWEIIQDLDFIKECRKTEKNVDLTFVGQPKYYGREKIFNTDFSPLTTNIRPTTSIYGIHDIEKRISVMKDFYVETAKSKFTLAPRGMGSSSFRFYQALMVGSVPILSGYNRLPFEDKIDYERLCIILDHRHNDFSKTLNDKINQINYDDMRNYGMKIWDEYFRIEKTDKHIYNILENEKRN